MLAQPLTPDGVDNWNGLAAESHDAWFWHTTSWLDFVQEMGRARSARDLSFFLTENAEFVAICPVIMEEVAGHRQFTYLGEFIPFPAFRPNLTDAKRQEATEFYVSTLDSLAKEHDVSYVRVLYPALAPSRLSMQVPVVDPLWRFGFFDVSWGTQLVDLTPAVDELWANVRKGHKSDIRRASDLLAVTVWDSTNITDHKFREYQELHHKDAGGVTRSQRSFDLMLEWVRRDRAALAEASWQGMPVAFALILLFGTGAYYGSSCKDPDHHKLSSSHLVQWRTMLWLKERQFRHYDLGFQHFGAQWSYAPSPKEISLSVFKRGFGGHTVRVGMAELYYSTTLLEGQFKERLAAYLASRKPGQ